LVWRTNWGKAPPPPPFEKRRPVSPGSHSRATGFLFSLVFKGFGRFSHRRQTPLHPPHFHHSPAFHSLFDPGFSVFSGRGQKLVRWDNPCYLKGLSRPACFGCYGNTACGVKKHPNFRTKSPSQDLRSRINVDFPASSSVLFGKIILARLP